MDLAELVTVGAEIAKIGARLQTLRAQRQELDTEIDALEKELMPLVAKHSKIIAEVVGAPPAPASPPASQYNVGPGRAPTPAERHQRPEPMGDLKRRLIEFLEDAEPGMSAADIASALRADPFQVRQIMADMSRGRS